MRSIMGLNGKQFLVAAALSISLTNCGQSSFHAQTFSSSDQGRLSEPPPDPPPEITPAPAPGPGPSEKVAAARWEGTAAGSRAWTEYAYKTLETDGLALLSQVPKDIDNFCPSYRQLSRGDKKNFWVYLISSLAQFESGFDPSQKYTESFTDSTGARVVSRGLLQLSYESALAYGCPLKRATDLHDPEINLLCTIKILNRWIGNDGVIRANSNGWKGGARYWSVLRRTAQYDSIRSWTKLQSYCH